MYFHYNSDFGLIIFVDNDTDKILAMEITGNNTMVTFDDFFESNVDSLLGIEE